MAVDDALLFIDTNKYLDLYRILNGKKLVSALSEQSSNIFVTQQIVDEVLRRKLEVTSHFLNEQLHGLKRSQHNLPDQFSGENDNQKGEILKNMREIGSQIDSINADIDSHALAIFEQVEKSTDEVSECLKKVFSNAVAHDGGELERAKSRKAVGNPPGKPTGPLGDEINWEQILTQFKGKRRLWIISSDGDFFTTFQGRRYLNALLSEELSEVAEQAEVYLFKEVSEGLDHFIEQTGVQADERMTSDEVEEIEAEERALPPLPSMRSGINVWQSRADALRASGVSDAVESIRALNDAMAGGNPLNSSYLAEQARASVRPLLDAQEHANRLRASFQVGPASEEIQKLMASYRFLYDIDSSSNDEHEDDESDTDEN